MIDLRAWLAVARTQHEKTLFLAGFCQYRRRVQTLLDIDCAGLPRDALAYEAGRHAAAFFAQQQDGQSIPERPLFVEVAGDLLDLLSPADPQFIDAEERRYVDWLRSTRDLSLSEALRVARHPRPRPYETDDEDDDPRPLCIGNVVRFPWWRKNA